MEDKTHKIKKSNWPFIPSIILQQIGLYLDLNDLLMCQLTCKNWFFCFAQSNTFLWKYHCKHILTEEALVSEIIPQLCSWKSKLKAYLHGWNPEDCSKNIYVKKDGFTLHRKPVARSSDGIRGKLGFLSGRHCWEIWWLGPLGTVASIGVATRQTNLHHSGGYVSLLGRDDHSWGWNLVENVLHYSGKADKIDLDHKYKVGDRLRMILDCDEKILSFERSIEGSGSMSDCDNNFAKLDFVFTNVTGNGKALFPAVSAVYGHSEVCIIYLGNPVDG